MIAETEVGYPCHHYSVVKETAGAAFVPSEGIYELKVIMYIQIFSSDVFGLQRFKFKLIQFPGLEDTEDVCIHSFKRTN